MKLIFDIFLVTDANRARRRRRQTVLNAGQQPDPNLQTNARQQPLPQNLQGQFSLQQQQQQQPGLQQRQPGLQQQQPGLQQQFGQGAGMGLSKELHVGQNQAGRQFYGYSNQYGVGSNYYPYGGRQYGAGQCKMFC